MTPTRLEKAAKAAAANKEENSSRLAWGDKRPESAAEDGAASSQYPRIPDILQGLKAYRVTCSYFSPPQSGVAWAVTPGQARYSAWASAREMGHQVRFQDFSVLRAKRFDAHPLKKRGIVISEEYLEPETSEGERQEMGP